MKSDKEDEDFDKVINTILRYPHGGLVDSIGGDTLSVEELLELRDNYYGSYGFEELKGLKMTNYFVENLLKFEKYDV